MHCHPTVGRNKVQSYCHPIALPFMPQAYRFILSTLHSSEASVKHYLREISHPNVSRVTENPLPSSLNTPLTQIELKGKPLWQRRGNLQHFLK